MKHLKLAYRVQRSLAIYYPHDYRVLMAPISTSIFWSNILVAPVESNKEFMKVFFPPEPGTPV